MSWIDKCIEKVVGYTTYIGIYAIAAVMLIIVANIIYRIFGGVIGGTYDLVEVIVVLVGAFALTNTELAKKNTNVDIILRCLKEKSRIRLEIFNNIMNLVYWVIICYATILMTVNKAKYGEVTDTLKVSIIPFRVAWSSALIILVVIVIYNIYRDIKELRRAGG